MSARRRPAIAAIAVVVALAASACGSSDLASSAEPGRGSAGTATGTSAVLDDAATTPPPAPEGTATTSTVTSTTLATGREAFAVATTSRPFDDVDRGRSLPTTIYFPSSTPAPSPRAVGDPVVEANGDQRPATGAFPLVVMAHGYLLPGDGYDRIMRAVAAHGYVVAAPELPHSTGHGGDGQRGDIVNQPADLSFVADRMIELGASGATPAIADPGRFAVVGHSDGGLTATALGYGEQFRDRRVAAVVSLTGGVALFPGAFYGPDSPPLLAVHARDDGTNPYRASVNLFNGVPSGRPRFLLTIDAGGHIDPYMFATARLDLGDAIAEFLDLTLANDPAALQRLRAVGSRAGFVLDEG